MLQSLLQETTPTTIPPTDPAGNVNQEGKQIIETLLESIPRIGIAIAVFVAGYALARLLRRFLKPRLTEARGENFGRVISNLIRYTVQTFAFIFAVTVVFPSVQIVDLLAGLGVFSIAIGFAFQDILSNLLAGILLLIREPFDNGDQIEVDGQRGTVQGITIRETQIKTFDGEKIIIPNAEVYQSIIRVQTAYGPKRTSVTIGIEDWSDLDLAADVCVDAIRDLEGVEADPAPQALFTEFGDSTTNFEVRWWTQPQQAEVRLVQDRVVRAIGKALRDAEIPMPSPIRELDARQSVLDLVKNESA